MLPSLSEVVEVSAKVERPITLIPPLKPPPILSEDMWGELKDEVRRVSLEPEIEPDEADENVQTELAANSPASEETNDVVAPQGDEQMIAQQQKEAPETDKEEEADAAEQAVAVSTVTEPEDQEVQDRHSDEVLSDDPLEQNDNEEEHPAEPESDACKAEEEEHPAEPVSDACQAEEEEHPAEPVSDACQAEEEEHPAEPVSDACQAEEEEHPAEPVSDVCKAEEEDYPAEPQSDACDVENCPETCSAEVCVMNFFSWVLCCQKNVSVGSSKLRVCVCIRVHVYLFIG